MKIFPLIMTLAFLPISVVAVPYASQIRVGSKYLDNGEPQLITYFINEAGGTSTIEIVDYYTSAIIAQFNAPAMLGVNQIIWDGTIDNQNGAAVPDGVYQVVISVNKNAPVGWTEISSNKPSLSNYDTVFSQSTVYSTLFNTFAPRELLISQDPNFDSFGFIKVITLNGFDESAGHVGFNPDLSVLDGNDGSNMTLNFPIPISVFSSGLLWGNCFDPENQDLIWACGQEADLNVLSAHFEDEFLINMTNANTSVTNARDIDVVIINGEKFAFITRDNSALHRVNVTGSGLGVGSINVLGMTVNDRYSKGVDFDPNGNVYWTSRNRTTLTPPGQGGAVFRWDADQIASASEGSLSENNAAWHITFPANACWIEGVAITPKGDVYAAVMNELSAGNDGSLRGIYYLGKSSMQSNIRELTIDDRVIAWPGTTSYFNTIYTGISADYAGNIYYANYTLGNINVWGPGGNTTMIVPSPKSQIFSIGLLSADVLWSIYE